ncbi:hypothetical protein EI982_14660 [Haloplanus rallus]|uniref:Uncharacterized protein n=1 Tax=Haloplanus rallus TaxID=1816183 RepID=A0A6B9FAY0_9EURY|nr:hypothetical protein [Haloplanus rallus]QGX95937.1 hypothetical protein EI982_14660 [Haloplanus rallus]
MQLAPAPPPTQGPPWLARLLYAAPAWVQTAIAVGGLLAGAVVAWRLRTDGVPDTEAQEQMGTIMVTAVAVATATIYVTEIDIGAYGIEVALGAIIGILVTITGKEVGRYLLQSWIDAERRSACAWICLTALLWTPAAIVPASERTLLLWSILKWGLLVSAGMALLTAHEDF